MENFEKINSQEKREKPKILYIAAQTPGIQELTPMRGSYRDENEGAVIFSTPEKSLASTFLVKDSGDDWMKISFYGDVPVAVINAEREEFIKNEA